MLNDNLNFQIKGRFKVTNIKNISKFKIKSTKLKEDDKESLDQSSVKLYIKSENVTYQYIIKSKIDHDSTQDISNFLVKIE